MKLNEDIRLLSMGLFCSLIEVQTKLLGEKVANLEAYYLQEFKIILYNYKITTIKLIV